MKTTLTRARRCSRSEYKCVHNKKNTRTLFYSPQRSGTNPRCGRGFQLNLRIGLSYVHLLAERRQRCRHHSGKTHFLAPNGAREYIAHRISVCGKYNTRITWMHDCPLLSSSWPTTDVCARQRARESRSLLACASN